MKDKSVNSEITKENNKIWVILGVVALMGGAYIYYRHKKRHPDETKIAELRRQI